MKFETELLWCEDHVALSGPVPEGSGGGVYVVEATDIDFPRLLGASPVVYIGMSDDLARRVGQLGNGEHSAAPRIKRLLRDAPSWGPISLPDRRLRVRVYEHPRPAFEEARQLAEYERKFGELPPVNRAGTGEVAFHSLRLVAEHFAESVSLGAHGERTSVRLHGPWDDFDQAATHISLAWSGRDILWLTWTWPAEWAWDGRPHLADWPKSASAHPQCETLYAYLWPKAIGKHAAYKSRAGDRTTEIGWVLLAPSLRLSAGDVEFGEGSILAGLLDSNAEPEPTSDILGTLRAKWAQMCASRGSRCGRHGQP